MCAAWLATTETLSLPDLTNVEVIGDNGESLRSHPAAPDGHSIMIECDPGVFAYRFNAGSTRGQSVNSD